MASDSSYAVSGTSSAGTARDRPNTSSTNKRSAECGFLIHVPTPDGLNILRLEDTAHETPRNFIVIPKTELNTPSLQGQPGRHSDYWREIAIALIDPIAGVLSVTA